MNERSGCPACCAANFKFFLEVPSVPVQSCKLVLTRDDALAYPRGSLRLAFCNECGFIWNHAFEQSCVDYAESYEETQGFSRRFREFARGLAERWVVRHSLQGKSILEIGCGKGEFLTEMLLAGVSHGTGIDPALAPERIPDEVRGRSEWISDFFGEDYLHLRADAIVCRHTLEHIAPVAEFLSLVRRLAGERPRIPILFELPDVARVLKEVAFWDIYYEHCSYFTGGSLARLFRRQGFEVVELAPEYDGQYLVLDAYPSEGGQHDRQMPAEESVDELRSLVDAFATTYHSTIDRWNTELQRIAARKERVVLWGGGSKAVAFLAALAVGSTVQYVVDINPHKHGKFIAGNGQEVVAPEFLSEYQPDVVIAMNPVYLDEIQTTLDHLHVAARLVSV
jgi:SAM-dependent methyltransferase